MGKDPKDLPDTVEIQRDVKLYSKKHKERSWKGKILENRELCELAVTNLRSDLQRLIFSETHARLGS